jgi:superfamily I DNA/RNA helicase/mRNA-degrading endonuclease RelE of RelBE toxin-antitoxin system
MAYVTAIKDSYNADYIKLNKNEQNLVKKAITKLRKNPDTVRGDTVKPLRMHERLWRYRIGDLRLIYAVYADRKLVQLLAVGHRKEIYDRFKYHPDDPEFHDYSQTLEEALHPDKPTPPRWVQYMTPETKKDGSRTLPYKLTPERLSSWGIPEEYHHHFQKCETENELLDCEAPEDYVMRVIELVFEPTMEDIAQEPNYVLEDPDDLDRYQSGDLIQFLLLLDKKQEQYVDWALKGPTLVKGGPGSGKSTVALYRARSLAEKALEEGKDNPSILFTTYTNSLVTASQQLLDRLLDLARVDVQVSTVDKIAWKIYCTFYDRPKMASYYDFKDALISAKAHFTPESDNKLERMMLQNAITGIREDYLIEEFEWVIEGRNIRTLEEYLEIERTGRGYAFNPSMRKAVWNIYQHAKRYLQVKNLTTWGEMRARALAHVTADQWNKRWDYVIIDEAQDLTPTALALCVELAQDPTGIFLTADASQSLYNSGFAWKDVHESLQIVGRTRILRRNYRTTQQIVEAAASLIAGTGAGDDEVLEQEYVHVGPRPKLYRAQTTSHKLNWLKDSLKKAARSLRMPLGSAAILSPTNQLAQEIATALRELGLPIQYMRGKDLTLDTPHVKSLTIHSAKGLEFPIVAFPYFEEGIIPSPLEDERAEDRENHLARERRLVFVGWTRAMRRLLVCTKDNKGSPFLSDLDLEQWNVLPEEHHG